VATLVLGAACLGACSSSGSDEGDAGGGGSGNGVGGGAGAAATFLGCSGDTSFHLAGNVGGESIDLSEAPTTGGFSQQSNAPGPHFRIPNSESEDTEELVVVFLTWRDTALTGEITAIDGWVRLPVGSPLAGETICAGDGSVMRIPASEDEPTAGDFQFVLLGLSRGSDCSNPVSGELRGCFRN
jgi:hypothetical protein